MALLTPAEIESLVENRVREGRDLEFKRDLPGRTDSDKREFLADVTSFANAVGGNLIYGIDEQDGAAAAAPGIASASVDAEVQRLENLLRDGVEPRLVGVQIRPTRVTSGIPLITIHVPRSWNGPHMVTLGGSSRFFSRNSNGKYPLDVYELRRAFNEHGDLIDRIRRFRTERLGRIVAGELPAPIGSGPYIVLHLVPFAASGGSTNLVDPGKEQLMTSGLPPMFNSGWSRRYNFDGFLTFFVSEPDLGWGSYVQLFRNGSIEAVDRGLLNRSDPLDRRERLPPSIPSAAFEKELIEALRNYCACLQSLGVEPPIAVLLSLSGVGGYRMLTEPSAFGGKPIERSELLVPEIVIESYAFDPASLLRPAIDSVWNASGYARSPYYNTAGTWRPPR